MDSAYIKFNGGIWSEVLKGRYDLGNYKSAARTCENFIPTRYGQVEKRAGTKHLGFARSSDTKAVLFPFQYSVDTKFILEFGVGYIRFWSNDQQVMFGNVPYEVYTGYQEDELYELQIQAVNDVIYIVHPNHVPSTLTRFADDSWAVSYSAISQPYVDPDVNPFDVTLTPSATTGNISLTASAPAFNADHVGSTIKMAYSQDSQVINFVDEQIATQGFNPALSYNVGETVYDTVAAGVPARQNHYTCKVAYPANATGSNVPPSAYFDQGVYVTQIYTTGAWSLKTTGTWNGQWEIQKSTDFVNFVTAKVISSSNDANFLVEDDEEGVPTVIRILGISANFGAWQNTTNTLTNLNTELFGYASITSVANPQLAYATVAGSLPATTPTISWQENAFSINQGYPRAVAVLDNRLVFAGTKKKPLGFFYSALNDFSTFPSFNTQADSPFFVEAVAEDQSPIQWITTQRELFVGTGSAEGTLRGRKQDEAQSAENLPVVRWSDSIGSAQRPTLQVRDGLLILQRGRTVLNMLSYSLEKDGYTGEEVTLLCPHLFSSGIQQMAHIREPYSGAFTVQGDGTMCHMVYEPKLEVTGWSKYTTQDGEFESVAVLPSSGNEGSDEDEVWCVVKRTLNGVTRRHIEHFTVGNPARQQANDADNLWYLDAAVKTTGSGLTTITGLDHLEGETVCVLADGIKGSYIVSGNQITLSVPADTVIVGLPITSEFEPFDLEVQFKGGDTYGKRKQLYDSKLMVWRSLGGSIAHDGQDYQDLIYHTAGETVDESVPLKDGWIEVFHESSYARQKYWRIKHDEPHPFTLQAVIQSFTVSKS